MKRPSMPGTAFRLATLHALIVAVVLGLAATLLVATFAAQTSTSTDHATVAQLTAFERAASIRPATQGIEQFATAYFRSAVLPDGELMAVVLPDGRSVGSVDSAPLLSNATVRSWSIPPAHTLRHRIRVGNQSYAVVAAPMNDGSRQLGTLVVAANRSAGLRDIGRVRRLVVGEALIALLAAVIGSYLLLRRLLRRIGRITDTAAGLGHGDLARRLDERSTSDEVGRLAVTFDAMADRLSGVMEAQRRLLSDVSHQLRTPLTVARGHLEVLDRTGADDPVEVHGTVALVVDELDHMRTLVEQLLMLGRAMEPDFLDTGPVDLRSFCADILDATHVLAKRDWQLAPVPDVVLNVDEAKLRGAILNLIDNSVRATKVDDLIHVSVEQLPTGGVMLSVDDNGPGIPLHEREVVVERFVSHALPADHRSGLGLAIVRAVAEAHGGSFELADSPLGGCRASITLPEHRVSTAVADEVAVCVS